MSSKKNNQIPNNKYIRIQHSFQQRKNVLPAQYIVAKMLLKFQNIKDVSLGKQKPLTAKD